MADLFVYAPGDKTLAAASAGKYPDMYARLNAGDMWHILRELEALWKRYGAIDLSPAALDAHLKLGGFVDSAPIFRERMKVAVAAVALAGVKTSIGFQKDYEAYLTILPAEQKQVILEYLAERAPARGQQAPNLLGVGPGQLTAWRIATSSGGAASVSYLTAGGGYLYLQHADREDETYRYGYAGVGFGKSVSNVSATYSTKDFPSGGIGRLYRSGTRAAGLLPSAFSGLGTLVSTGAEVTDVVPSVGKGLGAGAGVTLVLLGMGGSPAAYLDEDKLPTYAGAVGLMWGTVVAGGDKKVDAGVAITYIMVGPPERVTL